MENSIKTEGDFLNDLTFLNQHTDIIVLKQGNSAVAIAPKYQARLMTSTTNYESGTSFGWINRKVIEKGFLTEDEKKGKIESQIYIFGGEERFWLGPEGGQYSIFFKPEDTFEFSNWKTPAVIDTDAFELISKTETSAQFKHNCQLVNKSGTVFQMGISRGISILEKTEIEAIINTAIDDKVDFVAYQTDNQITNIGDKAWKAETGLPSIWMLGMYKPSPDTTVVIPFKEGNEADFGLKVNDTYFGKVPASYLKVEEDVLFLKGDGTHRAKIGVNPQRTKGIAGSYDAQGKVLTLLTYNIQEAPNGYVNSAWEYQEEPYAGDVINAYNDGSPEPGAPPLGPFYELESSSPAAALKPKETMQHIQTTFHFKGEESLLDAISQKTLGVGLDKIKNSFIA